jgi:hypothetical protein
MRPDSLIVVGTGIHVGQVTLEAQAHIEQAEKVLFLVADPVTINWITTLNPTAESLEVHYQQNKNRLISYEEMVERILAPVRAGLRVCAAFYGHPGVFVYPSHEAIRKARLEGFGARMLPGVSAEDCLFADLGVDPGRNGCQSFEATDFLVHGRQFDTSNSLILWQVGVVGDITYQPKYGLRGREILTERLTAYYGAGHGVYLYEASQYPVCSPIIQNIPLSELPAARATPITTLYVPPKQYAAPNLDMLRNLEINLPDLPIASMDSA